jgi:hypothetical protein
MPTDDALLAQLKIVNERSGTYGRQFWQVPFAYIAASGVVVAQLVDKRPRLLAGALLAISVIGGFAVWHLLGLLGGAKRSFHATKDLERALDLPTDRTQWKPGHLWAWVILTALAAVAALVGAALLLCTCH